MFDNDFLPGSPRDTATVAIGTAATGSEGFHVYSMSHYCDLAADGTRMRLGEELVITGSFPEFAIEVKRGDLTVNLEVRCTGQVTTCVRNPVYDHVCHPAHYSGVLTWQGVSQPISGLMSLEYARATSLVAFRDRVVPQVLKLPVNHFEWQVLKIAADTLLMFADASAFGSPMLTSAYIKQADGASRRHFNNVTHEILSYRQDLAVGPDGYCTRIPNEFRWRIHDDEGRIDTEIIGKNDTSLVYGLGRGWLGGFTYSGHHRGVSVAGTAYMGYARLNDPGVGGDLDD